MDNTARALQAFWLLLADPRARDEGLPVEEVARLLDVAPRQVGRFLNRLGQVGDITDGRGMAVDMALVGDRVKVYSGPGLQTGPLRLSPEELVALDAALTAVLASPIDEDLKARLEALRERLMALGGATPPAQPKVTAWPSAAADGAHFGVLREGRETLRKVEMLYWSERSQALKTYRICPCLLVQYVGAWYVIDERGYRFRVERIREATLTDEVFELPDLEALQFSKEGRIFHGDEAHKIRLRNVETGDEWEWGTASPAAVLSWVRQQMGAVKVVGPEALHSRMIEEINALIEVSARSGSSR